MALNFQHEELSLSEDESIPKVRKPYTITKQRERWTEEEHERFLEALKLYGRAWPHIEEHIGTKTAVQIRSHAQKFFSKLERQQSLGETRSGISQEIDIPPPRPKRKPNHPYPRKAPANHAPAYPRNLAGADKRVSAVANSSHRSWHPDSERESKDEMTRTPSSGAEVPGISVKNFGVSSERTDGSMGQSEHLQNNSDQKAICESPDELNVKYKNDYKPLFEKVERTSGVGSSGTTSNTTVSDGDCSMQNSDEMLSYGPIHPAIIAGTYFRGLHIPAFFQHQAIFDREHSAHLAESSRICGLSNPFVLLPSAKDIASLPCNEIESSNDKEEEKIKDTVPALTAATVAAASAWWTLGGFIAPGVMNPCSWPPTPSVQTLSAVADMATSKNFTKVQQITVPEGGGEAIMPVNPKRQDLKTETLKTSSKDLTRNNLRRASDHSVENESHTAETTLTLGSCRPSNEKHLQREWKAVSSESSYGCANEVLELKDRIELFRTSIVDCTKTTSNLENGYMEKGISSEVNGCKNDETKGVGKRLSVDFFGDQQDRWEESKRPRIAIDDEMDLGTANGAGRPHFSSTILKLGRDFGIEHSFEQVKLPRMFVGSQIEEAGMDKHTLKQVFGDRGSYPRRLSMKLVERNGHETGIFHQESHSSLLHQAASQRDSLDIANRDQSQQACSSMRMDTELEHSSSGSLSEAEEVLNPYEDVEETTASSPSSVLDLATRFPQKKLISPSAELFLPTAHTSPTERYSGVGFVPYCRRLRNN